MSFLLLENGSKLLLENGSGLLLEDGDGSTIVADDLISAICLALQADATVAGLATGGVWDREAPDADENGDPLQLPYVVVTELESEDEQYESPDILAGDTVTAINRGEIQVTSYASPKAAAKALGRAIAAVLPDAELDLGDAGELLLLRPVRSFTDKDPDKGPAGEDVWMCVVWFKSIVESTL